MARPVGSKNKRTIAYLHKAKAGGVLPLDYMLRVMRDDNQDIERRDDMAKASAPYLHAKLQAVELTGEDGGAVKVNIVNFSANNHTPK